MMKQTSFVTDDATFQEQDQSITVSEMIETDKTWNNM